MVHLVFFKALINKNRDDLNSFLQILSELSRQLNRYQIFYIHLYLKELLDTCCLNGTQKQEALNMKRLALGIIFDDK